MSNGQEKSKIAEEEVVKPKPKRIMVEFEGLTFVLQEFIRSKRTCKASSKWESGIEYQLILRMASHPYEEVFGYGTLELRDRAYELFKMKLQDLGFVFEIAKPTELPEVEPSNDLNDVPNN